MAMASSSLQKNKHSLATVIRFFKIVIRKSLEDGYLKIPNKFSRKYGDDMPNPVHLKPPDGTQWKIDWSNHDGEILFEKGWKEFAKFYTLDNGHLLWFEYDGTSNIKVHILDMSGLEIDYPSNDRIRDDGSIHILDEPPRRGRGRPRKKVKAEPKQSCPSKSKVSKSVIKTEVVERDLYQQNLKQHVNNEEDSQSEEIAVLDGTSNIKVHIFDMNGLEIDYPSNNRIRDDDSIDILDEPPRRGRGRPRKKAKAEPKKSCPSKSKVSKSVIKTETVERDLYQQNLKQHVKNEEDSQSEETAVLMFPIVQCSKPDRDVVREARKFQSKNPSFIIKIKQIHQTGTPASFPVSFFRSHFKNTKQLASLSVGKKQWPVTLIHYPCKKSALISCWRLFVRENKLKARDICVFELINREYPELKVHIHRSHELANFRSS